MNSNFEVRYDDGTIIPVYPVAHGKTQVYYVGYLPTKTLVFKVWSGSGCHRLELYSQVGQIGLTDSTIIKAITSGQLKLGTVKYQGVRDGNVITLPIRIGQPDGQVRAAIITAIF